MPIVGMTDQPGRLPMLGILRKGAPKGENRPGKDLDFFRLDLYPQYKHLLTVWNDMYGAEPKEITGLRLLGDTPDLAFTAWQEEWSSGTLLRRCDGQTIGQRYSAESSRVIDVHQPCLSAGKPPCKCKSTGRLPFYLPDFIKKTNMLGTFMLLTTSKNDIPMLSSYLNAIYGAVGSLREVPLIVGRSKRMVSTPNPNKAGERMRVEKSMLYLHVSPRYTPIILRALGSGGQAQLPDTTTIDPDTGEITAGSEIEYMPEDENEIPF